jgi:hypothetical protein
MAKILFINPVIREKDVPRHVPYGMYLTYVRVMSTLVWEGRPCR